MSRIRNVVAVLALVIAAAGLSACHGYKDNPLTCRADDECASKRCDLATALCRPLDAGAGVDAPGASASDAGPVPCVTSVDCVDPGAPVCVASVCVPCQAAPADACRVKSPAAPVCNPAAGRCTVQCSGPSDCKQADAPFCVNNMCVPCALAPANACRGLDPNKPMCDATSGRCAECVASGTCRSDAPVCIGGACVPCSTPGATADPSGRCPECADSKECPEAKPICAGGRCSACAASGVPSDGCAKRSPAAAVCEATSGRCVQCSGSADCSQAGAPLCVSNQCVSCGAMSAPADGCMKRSAAAPVCEMTSGRCVECSTSAQCSDPAKPVCSNNVCVGCGAMGAPADGCAKRSAALPVCEAASGRCVECTASSQCGDPTKPVCLSQKCVPCQTDAQCAERGGGPGVCLEDGRCATDAETAYVKYTEGACPGAGTAGSPFCSPGSITSAVLGQKRVIVIRGTVPDALNFSSAGPGKIVVVGQSGASLSPPSGGAAIAVSAGDLLVRGLKIAQGPGPVGDGVRIAGTGTKVGLLSVIIEDNAGVGVKLDGGDLRINRSVIRRNAKGGAVLTAGAYDIVNSVFDDNGPGSVGAAGFGGVYVGVATGKLRYTTVVTNRDKGVVCERTATQLAGLLAHGNLTGEVLNCTPASSKVGEDPRFDPARPYHITRQSPCFGAGGSDAPADDLDGDPRPLDGAVDCGADEFKQ